MSTEIFIGFRWPPDMTHFRRGPRQVRTLVHRLACRFGKHAWGHRTYTSRHSYMRRCKHCDAIETVIGFASNQRWCGILYGRRVEDGGQSFEWDFSDLGPQLDHTDLSGLSGDEQEQQYWKPKEQQETTDER